MKKSISIILLIVLLAVLAWFWKDYLLGKNNAESVVVPVTNSWSISDVLWENTVDQTQPEQPSVEIDITNLNPLGYTGGGEYTTFSVQKVQDTLLADKDLVIYFAASRDPTDNELDKDIQENIARIPENTVIMKVDYDTEVKMKKTFHITEQNTIIFLDKEGKEKTRRAIGITTLSQIVDVILDR